MTQKRSKLNRFSQKSDKNHGFTLIELVVALFVISIVVVIGIPSFKQLLERNRIKSASDSVFLTVQIARSQAITRQKRIVICPSPDGKVCDDDTPPAWNNYIIAYEESSANGFTRQNTEALLRSVKIIDGDITITPSEADVAYAYLPNGQIIGSAAKTSVDFAVSDNSDSTPKGIRVSVNRTGATTTNSYDVTP